MWVERPSRVNFTGAGDTDVRHPAAVDTDAVVCVVPVPTRQ